ncbi:MAG: alanine--tRNA ligase [Candidatus Micrarchaeota archaeon]
MLSKDILRKEFAKDYGKHYKVDIFEKEGFTRKTCKCGKSFWSTGKEDCGDSAHTQYSFFKSGNKKDTYASFWKRYAAFWKKNGHQVIKRYPVVSRWRPDLYFTMASIQDFQRIEGGRMVFEYPANPLVVPQMSLRFNDIANVGVTGRHFTCFMMAGQHAFNHPKEGYWRDECIRLNYEFLTGVLGIRKDEITYTEDVWAMGDFSAFGPCIESFANGLELVNSVFMQYSLINGQRRELDMKVIDVGWGFERLLWYSNGDHTAYDSVFPREIEYMEKASGLVVDKELFRRYAALASRLDADDGSIISEEEKRIARELGKTVDELKKSIFPLQAIYAIADHARSLLFAISDGSLPSNIGGGYNLRVLLRRSLAFIEEYDFNFRLDDIMDMIAEDLRPLYPELQESLPSINKILEVEKGRYLESRKKAMRMVSEIISKNKKLTRDRMIELYESHGVTPELVIKVANEQKRDVEIPTNFYSSITKKSFTEKKEEPQINIGGIPKTEMLYYGGSDECKARVISIDGKRVILDRTVFYPEGGGQATDTGDINGIPVIRADKVGEVVIHTLKKNTLRKGDSVKCRVNLARRRQLMCHHTATHLVNAACRNILGNHIWQAGAKKTFENAHLDITHYEKLSDSTLRKIELLANAYVRECHPISKKTMDRGKAEKTYGFILYQGGASPGKRIKVIDIDGIDIEACGGLHVDNTGQIGLIKITDESRIQDGINRIEFKAGEQAVLHVQEQEQILLKSSEELHVQPEHLPKTISKFFEEWKDRGKRLEAMENNFEAQLEKLLSKKGDVIKATLPLDQKALIAISKKLHEKGRAGILIGKGNLIVCVGSKDHNAKALLKKLIDEFGGSGGGNEKLAMGKLSKKPSF